MMMDDAFKTGGTTMALPVNGTVLDCLVAGKGPWLVAVHGALSDLRAWERLTPQLSGSNRVMAYTQRHFGPSPRQDADPDFSRDGHVQDLIALAETVKDPTVNLLGWSYGGDIAVRALLERPDLFGKAILFDPSFGAALAHICEAEAAGAEFRKALSPSISLLERHRDIEAAFAFVAGITGWTASETDAFEPGIAGILRDNARTLRPFLTAMSRSDQRPCSPQAFAALDVPALIVTGSRSLARYRLIADWLGRVWPNARRVQIEGATHFGPLEKSAEIGLEIRRFLPGCSEGI